MKTLKDFGWNNCPKREGWEGSICPNCGTNHTATEEFMKAEAIKWVKHIRKQPKNTGEEIFGARIVENWIMHFFNLTESDLK